MSFSLLRRRTAQAALGQQRAAAYSTPSSPTLRQGPHQTESSTAASDYKVAHPKRRPPPLPVIDPPQWSAQQAVDNILYNSELRAPALCQSAAPPPSLQPFTRHTLNCLVQNEPGVLSRVSGILAARGFNIDSLVVCATEIEDLSRMCIVLRGQDGVIEQARRQLEDLVPVWAVLDYTRTRTIERELLLAKISILGPEYFEDQLANKGPDILPATEGAEEGSPVKQHIDNTHRATSEIHPRVDVDQQAQRLSPSEALRMKHTHLSGVRLLAEQFGGKLVDISNESVIVEMTGKTQRVDAFLKLVRPYGILEAARTGLMVMPRAPISSPWSGMADDGVAEEAEAFDASLLPPG
ncbi:small subunit of acetolactate synthase-domain-containing protein [Rhodotorula diobovata]|uniref:Small subunit of acetolactate synthase-domain-containing protein n=1 Tax=Rhodotorula diobovata TaxID=5288 RepID=A0A5C5G542_9BASI|nr:small subunit of acetolactate synthase-domain-containing protein [Rhodotorula diobovata]